MTSNAQTTEETPKSSSSTVKPENSSEPIALQNEGEPIEDSAETLVKRVTKRENAKDKAKRLLIYGRLRVLKVDGNFIRAECRGDSGEVYRLVHNPAVAPPWHCNCAAVGPCSHLHALWAVTAVER